MPLAIMLGGARPVAYGRQPCERATRHSPGTPERSLVQWVIGHDTISYLLHRATKRELGYKAQSEPSCIPRIAPFSAPRQSQVLPSHCAPRFTQASHSREVILTRLGRFFAPRCGRSVISTCPSRRASC